MMNTQPDNQISNMNNNSESFVSPGKVLREAREQMGLSVNDVANRIKFAPRQIESLEADDYVRLPEAAFVRGFVRSYARLLELNPESLLTSLPTSHTQSSATKEARPVEITMPTASSARRYNVLLLAAGLVIALLVAMFERMHDRGPEQVQPVAKTNIQVLELPNITTESGVAQSPEQIQPQLAVTQPVVSPAPAPLQPAPQQPARAVPLPAPLPPVSVIATPAVVIPVQSVPPKKVPPSSGAQSWQPVLQKKASVAAADATPEQPKAGNEVSSTDHALRLEFDEDAWVEVKDSNNNLLVSRMHTAGSLVRVTGKSPLLVIVGNSKAVRLFDNGKKINLERYTTAEVARVKIK